jgi:hypothetical protein
VSLGDFTQQCAIETLQISAAAAEATTRPPDYSQLLIDGNELVTMLVEEALPEFLRDLSRADARVEEMEVLDITPPKDIVKFPIRVMDSERRLLQFSAAYRVSLQFLIRRSDLAVWSQHLSFHVRQEWDETRLRVQATIPIRVSFHMIQRGEETEAFSVVSISRRDNYKAAFHGIDPVAVKLHQTEIHAPEHTTWGTVKCEPCNEEFGIGCHPAFPANSEAELVSKLEQILAADHKAGRSHGNLYELGRS